MATLPLIRHSLDPTGSSANNLVSAEAHTLSTKDVRALLPEYGAFFYGSEIVTDVDSGEVLTRGTQYQPGEILAEETAVYGKAIYRMLLITDTEVSNNVTITYQALGAEYGVSTSAIISLIDTLELDDRAVSYYDLKNRPAEFKPSAHLHDLGDVYGFEYSVAGLDRIRQAIELTDAASHDALYLYFDNLKVLIDAAIANAAAALSQHMLNTSNPHQVTAAQLDVYTKAQTLAITNPILAAITAHAARTDNPHGVTAAQLGVYITSQVDTLIAAVRAALTTHTSNTSNPHSVTAAQLGVYIKSEVDSLLNTLATAMNSTIAAHTSRTDNPHNVTAAQLGVYTTSQVDSLISALTASITAHANRTDNPHNVTASQLGVYTTSQVDSLLSSLSSSLNTSIATHVARTDNPHNVTAAQLGVYTSTQIDSLISSMETSLESTIAAHVARTDNPHNVTVAQLGTYDSEYIDNLFTSLEGYHLDHVSNTSNPHGTTAAQLGAYTTAETDAKIAEAKAAILSEYAYVEIQTGLATGTFAATSAGAQTIYELRYNDEGKLQLYYSTYV